ncbi:glutathione S-transferase T1-like protein [Tanacetum coccineum]
MNPLHQIPAIVDRGFKLSERYPADIFKRAKIHSVLDWHHSNICRGPAGLEFNTVIAPLYGMRHNPQLAIEAEKTLVRYLSKLENFWLKDGQFLLGNSQPSTADISIACQVMQLEANPSIATK